MFLYLVGFSFLFVHVLLGLFITFFSLVACLFVPWDVFSFLLVCKSLALVLLSWYSSTINKGLLIKFGLDPLMDRWLQILLKKSQYFTIQTTSLVLCLSSLRALQLCNHSCQVIITSNKLIILRIYVLFLAILNHH